MDLQNACDIGIEFINCGQILTILDKVWSGKKLPIQSNITVAMTLFHIKMSTLPGKLIDRVTPNSISLQMYGLEYRFAFFHKK